MFSFFLSPLLILYYSLIFIFIAHYNLAKKDPIFKVIFIYIS